LELAHVLFTDIVAFSKLPMDQQQSVLQLLQSSVRASVEYKRALAADQLISLPTGDGMALVFFGDPESAVRCAQELWAAIRSHPELRLRMGVHSGPVYRVSDINANRNVTGGGINMAQRVMDCADAGHILVSKTTADVLMQFGTWPSALHDLGEAKVKHGVRIHIYNLYRSNVGNPQKPSKLRVAARKRGTRSFAIITVAVIAIAAGLVWLRTARNVHVSVTPTRRSVAVLGFKNLSGKPDQAWLSTALAQMMSTEIAAGQKLRTVPGESVAQAKVEFAIPDSDSLNAETLSKIKKRLGADLVVLGSYIEIGASEKNLQIRLDVRLQDADDGEVLISAAENGTIDNLFELVTRCGQQLRDRLSIGSVTGEQALSIRESLPSNPDAARLYSQGLNHLRLFDALAARDLFQKAIAIEADSAQAHSALSSALLQLGYQTQAAAEAKKALDLSTNLPREDHLRVEAQYHLSLKDWARTIELNQTLFGFYPDNLEYGLSLAYAQTQGGRNEDCLKTIDDLRKLPAPQRDDPRIDLLEAQSAEIMGDSKRAAAANQRAATKSQAMGARLLYAQARNSEGWNYRIMGDLPKAVAMMQEAEQIFEQAGDRAGAARCLSNIGATYSDKGDRAASRQYFEKSLAIDREIGYTVGQARALQNLGFLSLAEGKRDMAKGYLEQSLATSRSNGDSEAAALTLLTLSDFYYQADDPTTARSYAQQGADLAHSIGNKRVEAMALASLGLMLADSGNLPDAKATFEKGLAIFRDEGARALTISCLERLGQIEWSQGDLPTARKHLEEATQIAKSLGNARDIAIAESNLAEISVDEGHTEAAITALNAVITAFRNEQSTDDLVPASQYLAEAQMDAGKPADAKKTLETLRDKKGEFPNPIITADYQLASARIGDPKPAIAVVNKLLANKEFTEFESRLEVRLALGKIEAQAGRTSDARTHLANLQKDADAKGYGLWSKKASVVLATLK
jgi:tetratricopeptide (TPR) repeat protein/class 3 adenylate cyclase